MIKYEEPETPQETWESSLSGRDRLICAAVGSKLWWLVSWIKPLDRWADRWRFEAQFKRRSSVKLTPAQARELFRKRAGELD